MREDMGSHLYAKCLSRRLIEDIADGEWLSISADGCKALLENQEIERKAKQLKQRRGTDIVSERQQ